MCVCVCMPNTAGCIKGIMTLKLRIYILLNKTKHLVKIKIVMTLKSISPYRPVFKISTLR